MQTYELMAQCIRSDQMTARQVGEAFRDEMFAAWYRRRYP
jgi:hypothetical protein